MEAGWYDGAEGMVRLVFRRNNFRCSQEEGGFH